MEVSRVFRHVDADRDFPGVISHNAFLRTIRALRESSLLLYDLHLLFVHRGERQRLLTRHSADLLQQPEKIGLAAFFDDLPVRKPIEVHRLHLDLLPR
jgi:hypothetical protein